VSSLGRVMLNLEKIRPSKTESRSGLEMKVACAAAVLLRWPAEESLNNDPNASTFVEPSKTFSLTRASLAALPLLAWHSSICYSTYAAEA
jgi:hypothetical protein